MGDSSRLRDSEFIRDIRLLGELELSWDICTPPDSLEDGARLVDACPDTNFILDHCGNANVQAPDLSGWKRGIDILARRQNVVCKISGIVASAKPGAWGAGDLAPVVEHCAGAFGRDRIFFGSDWPVCTRAATLREWVEALKAIVHTWPAEDQHKLFHQNARRLYHLE